MRSRMSRSGSPSWARGSAPRWRWWTSPAAPAWTRRASSPSSSDPGTRHGHGAKGAAAHARAVPPAAGASGRGAADLGPPGRRAGGARRRPPGRPSARLRALRDARAAAGAGARSPAVGPAGAARAAGCGRDRPELSVVDARQPAAGADLLRWWALTLVAALLVIAGVVIAVTRGRRRALERFRGASVGVPPLGRRCLAPARRPSLRNGAGGTPTPPALSFAYAASTRSTAAAIAATQPAGRPDRAPPPRRACVGLPRPPHDRGALVEQPPLHAPAALVHHAAHWVSTTASTSDSSRGPCRSSAPLRTEPISQHSTLTPSSCGMSVERRSGSASTPWAPAASIAGRLASSRSCRAPHGRARPARPPARGRGSRSRRSARAPR